MVRGAEEAWIWVLPPLPWTPGRPPAAMTRRLPLAGGRLGKVGARSHLRYQGYAGSGSSHSGRAEI